MAADPHVLYSLASITKPITATALMVLVDEGKLDLDAPANDYLGEAKLRARVGTSETGGGGFPDPITGAKGATLRRLANHTSGLPLHYHFFHEDEPWARPSTDESILRYGNLVTLPGERYHYANFGYGILDEIISRVSGQTYADFIRAKVFRPLGMTRAAIDVPPGLAPYAAARYDATGRPIPFYTFDHPGASAAWCSAHDLARFGSFHLKVRRTDQEQILSDAAIDAMQVPMTPGDVDSGYGIGWDIEADAHGHRTVTHGGGMGGVATRLRLVPEEGIAVAVLANRSGLLAREVCDDVLAVLLPDYGASLEASRQKAASAPPDDRPPFRPSEGLAGEWEGRIHTWLRDLPFRLVIRDDGDIHARIGEDLVALVNDVRFEDDRLTGRFVGDIGTPDAARRPYHLHLDLHLRWNVLNGAVTAISLPGPRLGNALSHWCELERRP